MTAKVGAVQK